MESAQSPSHLNAQSPNHLFVAGVWMLVLATPLLLCGLGSGMFYLVAPFLLKNHDSAIQMNIFLGSFAVLGVLFGALWAWQGIAALRGRAINPAVRAFPPIGIFIALFLCALLLGWGAFAIKPIAAFTFPPFHFLAAALPPLAFLAYATHQLGATSGLRALVTSLSWGTFGSTFLALSLEAVIGVVIVVGTGVALSLLPDSAAWLEQLIAEAQSLRTLDDQTIIRRLLSNPGVIAAAGVYLVGIVPLVEETFKTLIVAFADPRRTTGRDALLWGIAAGAGFAAVESALNTGAALEIWILAMVVRVGATVMHVANGATMARGWYAARVKRRWGRLFIAYVTSVFLHAVWNALAIGQGVGTVVWVNQASAATGFASPSLWLSLACVLGLIVLTFGGVGWIAYAVRTAREPSIPKI